MDRKTWRIITDAIGRAGRKAGRVIRKCPYSQTLIARMYLWSVCQGKNLSQACDRNSYNGLFRPRKLPSISPFSRRVRSEPFQALLQAIHQDLAARGLPLPLQYIDGKPLRVGPASKDPHARSGHITGGFGKGYKLHAMINENRRIVLWSVMPLNVDEKLVAEQLLAHAPPPADPLNSLTLGDSNYDSAGLYRAFARRDQGLLAPLRCQQRVGPQGHGVKTLTKMGPARQEAVELWQQQPGLGRMAMKWRNNAEGVFSVLSLACGLHLPGFVRGLERVCRWVGAKIIYYHARLLARERAQTAVA